MTQLGKPNRSSRAKRLLDRAQKESGIFAYAVLSGEDADVIDDALLELNYETRRLLLLDVANLRDEAAVQWFWSRHKGRVFPERDQDLMGLRDEVRGIWAGDKHPARKILNKWLRWQPSQDLEEAYERFGFPHGPADYMPFTCSIDARRLVPNYMSLRSMLIQGVFEHWGHFKQCRNKDCTTPFFIAKRKDQTVCDSEACKAEKQREHALRWWTENRAKKAFPKGKEKDGTRKTR